MLAVFLVLFIAIIFGWRRAGLRPGTPLAIAWGMGMITAGIAAFVTGVISLIRFKDRSFVVILATVLGSLAVLMTIGEVIEGIVERAAR